MSNIIWLSLILSLAAVFAFAGYNPELYEVTEQITELRSDDHLVIVMLDRDSRDPQALSKVYIRYTSELDPICYGENTRIINKMKGIPSTNNIF